MNRAQAARELHELLRRRGWVVTTGEARELGLSTRQLAGMCAEGALLHPYLGVYAAPGALESPVVRIRAALAVAGPHSIASHATAGWLQGLLERPPGSTIDVTVPGPVRRRPAGIVVHRAFGPWPVPSKPRGLPCTPPARTLVDLARVLPGPRLAAALDRGLAGRVLRIADIQAELRRGSRQRPGAAQLRHSLRGLGYIGAPDPSVLESAMSRLLARYRLPAPRAEVRLGRDGRYRVDFLYADRRLVMELYGYQWHHSPAQMASDMARQRALTLDKWTVLVYTWRDVTREPGRVAAEIRAALSLRA